MFSCAADALPSCFWYQGTGDPHFYRIFVKSAVISCNYAHNIDLSRESVGWDSFLNQKWLQANSNKIFVTSPNIYYYFISQQ